MEQSDLPISYVHGGQSDLFEKVEHSLEGHKAGDSVSVFLAPDEAFGDRDPSLTYTDDIGNVPEEFRHIGAEVEMHNERGEVRKFVVSRIADGKLTVDGNHPMAGKNITFHIKIVAVRAATPDEVFDGVAPMEMPVLH